MEPGLTILSIIEMIVFSCRFGPTVAKPVAGVVDVSTMHKPHVG